MAITSQPTHAIGQQKSNHEYSHRNVTIVIEPTSQDTSQRGPLSNVYKPCDRTRWGDALNGLRGELSK
ncbi:uncharacterized protein ARMOST_05884 [Armillaria ostoyae]|uniref:Uncharacterized protein n=1 Tax=Armillaria ostoyae TaxID=47428 RepID=A0A284R1F2_ARMOS|nr:uncharacterized protein ARMOST_05884 [Armillaria ostoyae]